MAIIDEIELIKIIESKGLKVYSNENCLVYVGRDLTAFERWGGDEPWYLSVGLGREKVVDNITDAQGVLLAIEAAGLVQRFSDPDLA